MTINKKGNFIIIAFIVEMIIALFNIQQLQLQSLDEISEIFALVYLFLFLVTKANEIDSFTKIYVAFLLAMVASGLIGNVLHDNYSYSWLYTFEDVFLFLKPFVFFLVAYLAVRDKETSNYVFNVIKRVSQILIYAIFLVLLYAYITKSTILLRTSSWVPFPQIPFFVFFVGTAAPFAAIVGVLYILCLSDLEERGFKLARIMCIIILLSTQSGMGFGILIFGVLFSIFKLKKRMPWYYILLLGIIAVIAEWNDISGYLLSNISARSILFRNSFLVLKRFFPFGSGFSTYGSTIAAQHYSKLYLEYGFNAIWGLNPWLDPINNYLYDTYYPQIIAQLGTIGILAFIFYFIYLFKKFNTGIIDNNLRAPLLFGIFSILIMSTGQGAFGGIYGMLIMITLGVIFRVAVSEHVE